MSLTKDFFTELLPSRPPLFNRQIDLPTDGLVVGYADDLC